MTIKKLTVAAAIAVGIATCSFSSANAACPCNTQMPMASSPCTTCPTITTPATAKCPICGLEKEKCGCGCKEKSSCDCDCPTPSCKTAEPACATCPNTSCADLDMKQVYAYPNAIYGDNNYVGEQTNAIYSTETAWSLDGCGCPGGSNIVSRQGVLIGSEGCLTGAAAPAPNGCGCLPVITGAAAPCGCGCLDSLSGVSVDRNCCKTDSAACPIQIQTSNSMEALKKSFVPFQASGITGAAAPLVNVFPDVPDGYWAGCDINRLADTNVIAGYPDRTFKPGLPVSRAEFASMIVKGFNLNLCENLPNKSLFKDVPQCHWANAAIAKAVNDGIMSGYCGNKFKPNRPVTRAEALTALAHGINCDMDSCKANEILNKYCDAASVPSWAQIPVAKALGSGALNDNPNPNMISPNKDATRADIASMLQTIRVAAGYDKTPIAKTDCGCEKKTAYMESEEIVKIPTLKLEFLDQINAKSSHVGQQFATTTLEEVTINGKCYPCGSRVNGKIVEVIRPSGCEKGALKLAFTSIEDCDGCKADLPKQILTAQINCSKTPNAVARFVSMPFTLVGGLLGTVGRTTGGMISNLGNAIEDVSGGTGIAMGEVFQGQFRAAGRSIQDASKAAIIAPVDFGRTALSGTIGLFQSTGDEVAYLVDPKGNKIAAVNPKEHITIAFGCSSSPVSTCCPAPCAAAPCPCPAAPVNTNNDCAD